MNFSKAHFLNELNKTLYNQKVDESVSELNESVSELNEAKIAVIKFTDDGGKYPGQDGPPAKYFSNLKKAEKWLEANEFTKSKWKVQGEDGFVAYYHDKNKGYGINADLLHVVLESVDESINEGYDKPMKDSDIIMKFTGKRIQTELKRYKNLANKLELQVKSFKSEFSGLKKMLNDLDNAGYGTKSYFSAARSSDPNAKFNIIIEAPEGIQQTDIEKKLDFIQGFIDDSKSMRALGPYGQGFSDPGKFEYYTHIPGYLMTIGGK